MDIPIEIENEIENDINTNANCARIEYIEDISDYSYKKQESNLSFCEFEYVGLTITKESIHGFVLFPFKGGFIKANFSA